MVSRLTDEVSEQVADAIARASEKIAETANELAEQLAGEIQRLTRENEHLRERLAQANRRLSQLGNTQFI
jgi:cell shape-determining protein MreC